MTAPLRPGRPEAVRGAGAAGGGPFRAGPRSGAGVAAEPRSGAALPESDPEPDAGLGLCVVREPWAAPRAGVVPGPGAGVVPQPGAGAVPQPGAGAVPGALRGGVPGPRPEAVPGSGGRLLRGPAVTAGDPGPLRAGCATHSACARCTGCTRPAGCAGCSLQGAAVWLRPPEPGCEVEASLPTLSAVGGVGGAPDLVRLVDTVATHCHRIRLRRSCAQALAFS
ncbi:hypothetical protein ACFRI7_35415 [Streptomyces sp. NPDC056716]|uniref:hypothetical protein n=1 Tax=unclassified Streptomyces TaxID=2593676 RepID=UPI0036C1E0D8